MQQQSYDKTGRLPGTSGAAISERDPDFVEVALHGIVASNKAFMATLRQPRPGNDAFYGAPERSPAAAMVPTSYELHLAARFERAALLGDMIFAAAAAVIAVARRSVANVRQRLQARAAYETMQRLDTRTLRDIGLERNELAILALELKGEAAYEQARSSLAAHYLPR